jgi:hypothetical protein
MWHNCRTRTPSTVCGQMTDLWGWPDALAVVVRGCRLVPERFSARTLCARRLGEGAQDSPLRSGGASVRAGTCKKAGRARKIGPPRETSTMSGTRVVGSPAVRLAL